jgi:phosphatidylglycerophosphate synthase
MIPLSRFVKGYREIAVMDFRPLKESTAIRDRFNAALTPIARQMAGVDPDVITAFTAAPGFLAGLAFAASRWSSWLFLAGGIVVGLSGVLDGPDGVVARLAKRTTRPGDFLDHFLDRVVEVAVLVGLAVTPGATTTLGLVVCIVVLVNSYLGTQIHASFGRRSSEGLGKAQLFVGLILVSVVLAWNPALQVSLGSTTIGLVGLGSLAAIAQRLRLAMKLSRATDE